MSEKTNTKKVVPIILVLIVIGVAVIAIIWLGSLANSHDIGDRVIVQNEDGESVSIVYVGAKSEIYADHNSETPLGYYAQLLNFEELANAIDDKKFPVALEWEAVTASTAPAQRYLVHLQLANDTSPQKYWIQPIPITANTEGTTP